MISKKNIVVKIERRLCRCGAGDIWGIFLIFPYIAMNLKLI
jgi:hypothetical protein